jgi:quercetin dioxygenase-like cupin family protein
MSAARLRHRPGRALFGALALLGAAALAAPQLGPLASGALQMASLRPSVEAQAGRPATSVTPVACSKLPHVPGKSITTVKVHFPPNGLSPKHRHAGAVTVYVLSGAIRSQLAGEPVRTFRPGDSFFEPPGAIHLFAENASLSEPAEILAIFVAEDCAQLTTYED